MDFYVLNIFSVDLCGRLSDQRIKQGRPAVFLKNNTEGTDQCDSVSPAISDDVRDTQLH